MMGRIWCDNTVCGQEWVLQVKALKKHYAKYAGTKSQKDHQDRKRPLLIDWMKKRENEGTTRRSIIEEKIPIDSLPGSLLCSQVLGAGCTAAYLAPGFTRDLLWCSPNDVPRAEGNVASGMDLNYI